MYFHQANLVVLTRARKRDRFSESGNLSTYPHASCASHSYQLMRASRKWPLGLSVENSRRVENFPKSRYARVWGTGGSFHRPMKLHHSPSEGKLQLEANTLRTNKPKGARVRIYDR